MPYRKLEKPHIEYEDTLPVFSVYNGTDTVFSVPCFYLEAEPPEPWHDYHLHDHIGWPSPKHPDHICQMPIDFPYPYAHEVFQYVDMDKATPIHWGSDYENTFTQNRLHMAKWGEGPFEDDHVIGTRGFYITFDEALSDDGFASGSYVPGKFETGDYEITHFAAYRPAPDDHIIDLFFSVDGPTPEKPIRLPFTLFTALRDTQGENEDYEAHPSSFIYTGIPSQYREAVLKGVLEILPSDSYYANHHYA